MKNLFKHVGWGAAGSFFCMALFYACVAFYSFISWNWVILKDLFLHWGAVRAFVILWLLISVASNSNPEK